VIGIDQEHPEYVARKAMWKKYRDLYAGGEQLKDNASLYLTRRQKEPYDVYQERLSKVFYENYIGSIIDWYTATLFRREPVLTFEGNNDAGKQFFNNFSEDCDQKGTALSDFFRRQMTEALVSGASYILVDFPRVNRPVANRAEEDAVGASRAYLVDYRPENVINWSLDERGNLAWVVLRTTSLQQESLAGGYVKETRWMYYDKREFRVFRRVETGQEKPEIELIDQGRHSLWKQERVPLFELKVSEGLWLMNKAGLLQLEHFSKANALSWALTMGLFAMPVVYSDREWKQVVGESYYIQLGANDKFGWTEPEGKVYQIAADNLVRLKDEIYRVCYLLTQAGGTQSSYVAQSAMSKQRDYSITQEVLRAYGDAVKDVIKRVLRSIEAAREDDLAIDVSGVDEFDIGDFTTELEDATKLLGLGIQSKTLKRQVFKKLAFKYLCDMRQETKDHIAREIDAWFESMEKKGK
jgi:hypothetical protein